LRSACLKLGSELTERFLRLDNEIDNFASQGQPARRAEGPEFRTGLHTEFHQQLKQIEMQATDLQKAAGEKRKKIQRELTALDRNGEIFESKCN
jgi:hypothetical protein